MEQKKTNFISKPLFAATAVVLGHFAVVIWHLLLLVSGMDRASPLGRPPMTRAARKKRVDTKWAIIVK